ncbi:glycosyl transferase [Aspergillus luchuensis]|uniref:Glycosyl transferase n=1 Tax=Aspergillus kawachii TaxID=1069201 RepID=A0A146FTG1_ASPKA|nr:glycosyl transferase [Aspergillus luchuensis]
MTRYLLDQEGRWVSKAVQDRRNLVAASARMNVHSLSGNGTTVQGDQEGSLALSEYQQQ